MGVGYFSAGPGAICYGTRYGQVPARSLNEPLVDACAEATFENGTVYLPFDPCEIATNLRGEFYSNEWRSGFGSTLAKLYYLVRPLLTVGMRKYLQKLYLKDWEKIPFPRWPVDCSVDNLFECLMLLALKATGAERIPFIWFWPDQKSACAIMTHDVETKIGRDFCPTLMDIDESYGIKASIQVVPEERYTVSAEFLRSIRERGFEVAVHDLNHDGHLYRNRQQFLERAARINSYLKNYAAEGFRAAVLYRKQVWYDALECSFDMSVPNVAHLDPQRGGCCTVMPYFLGNILEIPVTAIQDYTLFHILGDHSIDIWKKQCALIMAKNGLMSFIVHPDYIVGTRQRDVYQSLLKELVRYREEGNVWTATPGEVNRWWRQRAAMELVRDRGDWQIVGDGWERASIAWAEEVDQKLVFTLQNTAASAPADS